VDIEKILKILKRKYPVSKSVRKEKPFRVLISTILSQRTRDANTDKASAMLFSVLKTPRAIADAGESQIRKLIRSSGFYRVKAKRIKEVSGIIIKKFKGKVPDNLTDLLSLPGVGRKTANCVLVFGFKKPVIPVDTHVHRISNRLGIVKTKKPDQTESRLMSMVPPAHRLVVNELFVRFGQDICSPVRPKCEKCGLKKICKGKVYP